MKRNYLKVSMVIAAVLLLAGMGTAAFADWGMGNGRHMGYGPGGCGGGCGYGQSPGMGGYHRGFGPGGNRSDLTAEEMQKLEAERDAFMDATRDVRRGLRQKGLELESELAKSEPDAAKAAALQKEISDLRTQLEQKRIEHRITMQKLFPDDGVRRGPGPFGKRGPRAGGPGACWY